MAAAPLLHDLVMTNQHLSEAQRRQVLRQIYGDVELESKYVEPLLGADDKGWTRCVAEAFLLNWAPSCFLREYDDLIEGYSFQNDLRIDFEDFRQDARAALFQKLKAGDSVESRWLPSPKDSRPFARALQNWMNTQRLTVIRKAIRYRKRFEDSSQVGNGVPCPGRLEEAIPARADRASAEDASELLKWSVLEPALSRMSPRAQVAVLLQLGNRSVNEIAAVLHVSEATVRRDLDSAEVVILERIEEVDVEVAVQRASRAAGGRMERK